VIPLLHAKLLMAAGNGGFINPGNGTQPPGGTDIVTIIEWVTWLVFAGAIAAVIVAGGRMMWARHNGAMSSDHTSTLAYTLGGVIIAGFATGIVQALA
jgi:hypothetical protein